MIVELQLTEVPLPAMTLEYLALKEQAAHIKMLYSTLKIRDGEYLKMIQKEQPNTAQAITLNFLSSRYAL